MNVNLQKLLCFGSFFIISSGMHAQQEPVTPTKAPEKNSIEQSKQQINAVAGQKPQLTIAEQIAQKEHEITKVKQIMAKQRELAQQSVENASDVLEREAGRFAGRRKEIKLPEDYEDLEGWEATKEKAAVYAEKAAYATAEYATKGAQLFLDWVAHPLAVHPKSAKQVWNLAKLEKDLYFLKREQEKMLKSIEEKPAVDEREEAARSNPAQK